MTSKKTFCYFFSMFNGFIQHVFLTAQKHLTQVQTQIGKTRRAFLTHQPSKIPTASRSYQAKTNMLISLGKVFDLMTKRYISNVNKHMK